MKITELKAKLDGTTLRGHTADVEKAALAVYDVVFAAPDVRRAAYYHDIGKASLFFQQKMHGEKPECWYRHELLSLLLAYSLPANHSLTEAELASIISHHRNLNHPDLSDWMEDGTEDKLNDLANDQLSSEAIWKLMKRDFPLLTKSLRPVETIKFMRYLHETVCTHSVWSDKGRTLALWRATLVAADHLASAGLEGPVEGRNITAEALQKSTRSWSGWRPFQEEVAAKVGNAMLVAPTGAGKTEAALLWAIGNRRRFERIFYVLPYQVSINSMADRISRVFPDELGHKRLHDNENLSILHANTDLAYLQDALSDDISSDDSRKIALANRDAARQIYAPIKVTTVYQLLEIFFGRKFFEVGLLELTDSLVIFDEIHAYDGHTMGLVLVLLDYLQKLNARVLIMTATLPRALKRMLIEAAGISEQNEVMLPEADSLCTEVRRQVIRHDCTVEEMTREIRSSVELGKKTAVVCNTVKKAICLFELLEDLKPLLVHSRFTLGDRADREREENLEKYRLVISTQVIEVSLDISFDVMFTELAPADSLIQRFGRVNRHGHADPTHVAPCHVACGYDKGSDKIYDSIILQRTSSSLPEGPLNYLRACQWIEKVYPEGLSANEIKQLEKSKNDFLLVVKGLSPMLDPLADIELETNLFKSVQVVPAGQVQRWRNSVENRDYLSAKQCQVNVEMHAWCGAEDLSYKKGLHASHKVRVRQREVLAAHFEYDMETGLRLDRPLPSDTCGQIL